MIRKILSIVFLIIGGLGCYGFILGLTQASNSDCSSQLPIHDVQGIIVTESGIYIGLGHYNRIQKYDLQGNYITCWKTNTYSKDFTFRVNQEGEGEVVLKNVSRRKIDELKNSKKFDTIVNQAFQIIANQQQIKNPLEYHDKYGNLYKIKGWIFKKLVKIHHSKEDIIINQNLQQNIFNGVLKPWILGVFGIICFLAINLGIITRHTSDTDNFSPLKTFIDIFN